jgi:hypothetical protein
MGKEGLPYKLQKEVAKEILNQIKAYDVPSKARYTNNWAIRFRSISKEGKKFRTYTKGNWSNKETHLWQPPNNQQLNQMLSNL